VPPLLLLQRKYRLCGQTDVRGAIYAPAIDVSVKIIERLERRVLQDACSSRVQNLMKKNVERELN
jgi:hypothetical protein